MSRLIACSALCLVFLLCPVTKADESTEPTVDLVFAATAPPLFTEQRIREHLMDALTAVPKYIGQEQAVTVEAISAAEHQDLKRLAEGAVELVESMVKSPTIFQVESTGAWIVHTPDPGMNVSGIRVEYEVPGELGTQTKEWQVDAVDAQKPEARFRIHSRVNGDYSLQPEGAWSLLRYQLLPATTDSVWTNWPRHRRMFLIRIENFPADDGSYGQFKQKLQSRKVNAIRFQGEREGFFSIAKIGQSDEENAVQGGWTEEAFNININVPKVDGVWLLFPLTAKQKDTVVAELKGMISKGETEKSFALKLKDKSGDTLAGHKVSPPEELILSGKTGAKWSSLDVTGEGNFRKAFRVTDVPLWRRMFVADPSGKPSPAFYVMVSISEGKAVTVGREGEFWAVRQEANWNGGQQPTSASQPKAP